MIWKCRNRKIGRASALAIVAVLLTPALAVTHLERGKPVPEIALPTLAGQPAAPVDWKGRSTVLIFGELYHSKTREVCQQIEEVVKDGRLTGQNITPILIVTQGPSSTQPAADAKGLPALVLLDSERAAFGAYRVAVLPSVVVVDGEGKVVHALAGLMPQTADLVKDSLLLAAGKLSAERFAEALHPVGATAHLSDEQVKSQRSVQLARQLARRGLDEMAVEKYTEAIKLDKENVSARLGLGMMLLDHRRLPEAEAQFRAALALRPEMLEGELGLAFVQTLRGGGELEQAEKSVRRLLVRNPNQPRVHYLLGVIQQQHSQFEDAAASFRRASELFMDRREE